MKAEVKAMAKMIMNAAIENNDLMLNYVSQQSHELVQNAVRYLVFAFQPNPKRQLERESGQVMPIVLKALAQHNIDY